MEKFRLMLPFRRMSTSHLGARTHRIEVRQPIQGYRRTACELGNDTECGECRELVIAFKDPLKFLLGSSDAKVVEYHVSLYSG